MKFLKRSCELDKNMLKVVFGFSLIFAIAVWIAVRVGVVVKRNVAVTYGGVKTVVRLERLPEVQLLDIASSRRTTVDLSTSPLVLIVFLSAADCWACMGELPEWKMLGDEYPTSLLREAFVFIRSTANEVSEFVSTRIPGTERMYKVGIFDPESRFAPDAQIFLDKFGEADHLLDLPQKTPLTVLLEGKTRRVILAEGADTSPEAQKHFEKLVSQVVQAEWHQDQIKP